MTYCVKDTGEIYRIVLYFAVLTVIGKQFVDRQPSTIRAKEGTSKR